MTIEFQVKVLFWCEKKGEEMKENGGAPRRGQILDYRNKRHFLESETNGKSIEQLEHAPSCRQVVDR